MPTEATVPAVLSVTEVRNALRCPRAFVLGRAAGKTVAYPMGSSCLGASFHRLVDRFARTVAAPPPDLVPLATRDPARVRHLDRWILGLLIRELQGDPGYASIPAEVDDLAEACRCFSSHLGGRLGQFPGTCGEALVRMVRSGERPVQAAYPEADVVLRGRIDGLFGAGTGELEVVEYKLTDEANGDLDRAQVALYRDMLRRAEGLDAHPVVLRLMPEAVATRIGKAEADGQVRTRLVPLLRDMRAWLERPASAPATVHGTLCGVCPVQALCASRYPQPLQSRDAPPGASCRLRPALEGNLVLARPVAPAVQVPVDPEGQRTLRHLQERILEEFRRDGIPAQINDPMAGPRQFVLPVTRSAGPVARMDQVAQDVCHRLTSAWDLQVTYLKLGPRREFIIRREPPRQVPLGPLLAAKARWLGERPGRLVVGQQPDGQVLTADLADSATPHLLIGGGSGSGKSWLLRSILASLVHFHDPSRLRLTLLDPKRVTFTDPAFHSAIAPHLDGPVLFGVEEALPCFARYIEVMEERYERFAVASAADLHEYNSVTGTDQRLPRHVIVMDEFGDLTVDRRTAQDFRAAVQRLGAKARAAGIHLILATQRPDRDTVDPSLKSNLGGKLALRVASAVNSRIILDQGGAEQLYGNGDLLADLGKGVVRAQAPVLDARGSLGPDADKGIPVPPGCPSPARS